MPNKQTYNRGPELPNYMKPKSGATRPSSAASAYKKTPAKSQKPASANKTTNTKSAKPATARPKKRKRKVKNKAKSGGGMIAIVVLSLILFVLIIWPKDENTGERPNDYTEIIKSEEKFAEGVSIEGVDVGGKTADEAVKLVKIKAEEHISQIEYTCVVGDGKWKLTGADFGMSYELAAAVEKAFAFSDRNKENASVEEITETSNGSYNVEYTWNKAAIKAALDRLATYANVPASEPFATLNPDYQSSPRFTFTEGKVGVELDVNATANLIEQTLAFGKLKTELMAAVNVIQPTQSIEDIKPHTVKIAAFSTSFSAPTEDEKRQNRLFNIKKAADIISGTFIPVGAEWSFNESVGPRTYDLGWKGANGISGGKEYTTQAGGGICQVSTTLYNALLRANMKITDRSAHSIPSDYVNKGLDATVDTGRIDFAFKNITSNPIYILSYVKLQDGSPSRYDMIVELYGESMEKGLEYRPRSVITEVVERVDTIFTEDDKIPTGYQREKVLRHDSYTAEVYLDKYIDGVFVESKLLYTDKYRGNPAEIVVGIGEPLPEGAQVPDGLVPFGTPPTVPG